MDDSRIPISSVNSVWSRARSKSLDRTPWLSAAGNAGVRVDDDEVGLFADVEVAEAAFHVERPCAGQGAGEQHLGGVAAAPAAPALRWLKGYIDRAFDPHALCNCRFDDRFPCDWR